MINKEKAMTPVPMDTFGGMQYPACPVCRTPVADVHKYCSGCGQKLDWENYDGQ